MTATAIIRKLNAIPHWAIALLARLGVAGVFWRSGQTKVDGFEITDNTFFLFEEEYQVPLLPPDVAAYLATAAEHVFPVMLVVGLGARLGAAGLLAMTLVIQLFVYPMSWPDHLMWAAALAYVIARGPGCVSLDHLIARKCRREGLSQG
jgi:putative oxidoreductase